MTLSARYRGAAYRASLGEDLGALIESKDLSLSHLQKGYIRTRWLQQILRLEYELQRTLRKYQILRLGTAIGCLIILMLVSLGFDELRWGTWSNPMRYTTIFFALFVSGSVVVEHLFNYGQRWRETEQILDRLQTEGWRFLQLSGHYRHYEGHADAFPAFVNQVEELSQHEVEVYSSTVLRERRKGGALAEMDSPKKLDSPSEGAAQTATQTAPMRDIVPRRLPNQRAQ